MKRTPLVGPRAKPNITAMGRAHAQTTSKWDFRVTEVSKGMKEINNIKGKDNMHRKGNTPLQKLIPATINKHNSKHNSKHNIDTINNKGIMGTRGSNKSTFLGLWFRGSSRRKKRTKSMRIII